MKISCLKLGTPVDIGHRAIDRVLPEKFDIEHCKELLGYKITDKANGDTYVIHYYNVASAKIEKEEKKEEKKAK